MSLLKNEGIHEPISSIESFNFYKLKNGLDFLTTSHLMNDKAKGEYIHEKRVGTIKRPEDSELIKNFFKKNDIKYNEYIYG